MSESTIGKKASRGSMGIVTFLTILFVILKLTGLIVWSWWWVLSPLWLAPVIIIAGLFVALLFIGIIASFSE